MRKSKETSGGKNKSSQSTKEIHKLDMGQKKVKLDPPATQKKSGGKTSVSNIWRQLRKREKRKV